jgi:hypothetical protein
VSAHFVVVAGNIGVGKSTLVARLAQRWGWQAAHEPNDENPYLVDFYADMRAWAFHSQVFFLTRRLEQHNLICANDLPTLQDRSVYEDAEVFARNLHAQGHLAGRDWTTYYELYSTMARIIRPPDVIVYLRASVETLLARIAQRGRDYERDIPPTYLAQLNGLYDDWARRADVTRVRTIDADDLNWAEGDKGLDTVATLIETALRQR